MYAVIFRAEVNSLDEKYSKMALKMRNLAINDYGCTEFTAVTEDTYEIAISYWNNLQDIKKWKQNTEHLVAQELGKTVWYKAYKIQIVEIKHEYNSSI